MEEMNQAPVASNGGSNAKVILGIIVVLAIAAAIYFMGEAPAPQEQQAPAPTAEVQDTTEVISKEIESVDIEALDASLDADLKAIDEQLNGL